MTNQLWADIQAQGENLPSVVEHLYGAERGRIDAAAAFLQNDRPVVMLGVASAQYLCKPAVTYLNQRGRPAVDWCASEGLYTLLPALKHANVVINSRSGETIEIVKLGRRLSEERIPFVAITNEPESTLARLADHVVWANTRKDDLVSINVVTGMMLATMVLSAAVVGELDAFRPRAQQVAEAMPEVVERAGRQAADFHRLLAGARPIYLLYRGGYSGAAYCGRLVLEEVARQPAVAMGAAEFRQGPNEVIDGRFGAVVFVSGGQPGELNRKLADDIRRSGGRVLVVGNAAGQAGEGEIIFPIPDVAEELSSILGVVPVQLLAYRLAQSQGYEPGEVRYISKIILAEDGIPNRPTGDSSPPAA